MPESREYKINIDPRILELLGPSLYTNIYYVLAELIANAYDANASNVYIINRKDHIIVEDDGTGMSYSGGDIALYLNVAFETRTSPKDSYTKDKKRKKIGRKGIGKLAALSVSENVLVMTAKNEEKSGFVLSRHVEADHLLKPLTDDEIKFERIAANGTSIVMTAPQYGIHKTASAIKRNLLKIFPLVNKEFRIHVITEEGEFTIDSFDEEMVQGLGALVILGREFAYLSAHFDPHLSNENAKSDLLKIEDTITRCQNLRTRSGEDKNFDLEIRGWIGAYRSTRGRKEDPTDFPDNFISLLANGKLGEYNILPIVGRNRLEEVYVVGQLHVDLFEETELADIALVNRQGYKTDDPRYQFVTEYVRDTLLPRIVELRGKYADFQKEVREKAKKDRLSLAEKELRAKVDEYKEKTSKSVASKLVTSLGEKASDEIELIIKDELNASLPLLGLKSKVDAIKKKILICHTAVDKPFADVLYKLLVFNDVEAEDIIYTNCDDADARIPEGEGVYNYLREFFVNSYSAEKIIVLYVTSEDMAGSWGAVTEVGAGWITRKSHKIFNLNGHRPQLPLNIEVEWQTSVKDGNNIEMTPVEFDKFIEKILDVCVLIGGKGKSKTTNEMELRRYVTLI